MKCGVHNFYHNFSNATGGNDIAFMQSMIIDEITKLIADRPDDFVEALRAAGVNISKNAGVKQITQAFLNNIQKDGVQRNITFLILENNGIRTSTKLYAHDALEMLNADGGTAANIKETLKDKNAFSEVNNAINTLGESFNGPEGKKNKAEVEKDIIESITDTPSTGSFGKVFKFVAVASILSFAAYKFYKWKTKK